MSDLSNLVDMGFDEEKSTLALKHGGNLQGAIDWLDKNADKSIEDLQQEARNAAEEPPALKEGEEPKSLVCNECQKRFRSTPQAEFHASKSGHTDFSESTEEIAPLTEEEKAAKLAELKQRLVEKRAGMSEQDKIDKRKNEEIRKKNTKEASDAKEHLARQEQIKEAQAKRREKQSELEAKKRVQAKIAADKEERRRKTEMEKAKREGQTFPADAVAATLPPSVPVPQPPKTAASYTEARLRLQTPSGTALKNFPAETTLFEVAHALSEEQGVEVTSFSSTFPRKTWDKSDFGMTLKEAGLVPSAVLIVK